MKNSTGHLELVRLLDDHLQAAVLPQDGLPHLSYPAGLLFLGAQLPFRAVLQEEGRSTEWNKVRGEKCKSQNTSSLYTKV